MDVDLARPTSWMQATTIREANGTETPLPTFDRHLLCDEQGLFPEDFNSWEGEVVGSVHAGGVISGSDVGGLCGGDFAAGFALRWVVTGPVG